MGSLCRDIKGFMLLEVLIGMLILTIGLLGLASMQGQALRATSMGGHTTLVNNIIRDVSDRIIKNATNVGSYDSMDTTGAGLKPNCPNIVPEPVCSIDFTDWQNTLANLPQGGLQITSVASANFDTVTVRVSWQDAMGNHSLSSSFMVAP